jgi:hypothetical protein
MTIRFARPDDADFIAKTILPSQRGYRPRGWFDIALGWPEAECRRARDDRKHGVDVARLAVPCSRD